MSTTLLRTRIDTARIREGNKILGSLGLDPTSAVNMFYAQLVEQRGIPFPVVTAREPNDETIAAMREVKTAAYKKRPAYNTAREAMAALRAGK